MTGAAVPEPDKLGAGAAVPEPDLLGAGAAVPEPDLYLVQVLLFLNLIYFPCWLAVCLLVVSLKFQLLSYLYKFVLVTVLSAFILIELVRLYLGYLGTQHFFSRSKQRNTHTYFKLFFLFLKLFIECNFF